MIIRRLDNSTNILRVIILLNCLIESKISVKVIVSVDDATIPVDLCRPALNLIKVRKIIQLSKVDENWLAALARLFET